MTEPPKTSPGAYPAPRPARQQIFCNRTLNIRGLKAIGFDMDYTLIHYKHEEWEALAYSHVRQRLIDRGWPVGDLRFDPALVTRGLIVDKEHGNVVKANRFGFVKKACHGTHMLEFRELKELYSREQIDLGDDRWRFLNTFFGLSEACIYLQAVDLLDQDALSDEVLGYEDVYRIIRSCIDETHVEGALKAEIIADPGRFIDVDDDLPLTLLDIKHAGKKILLITNSEWHYTRPLMEFAFDPHLPGAMTWKDLFDIKIVQARKPSFFTQRNPLFVVVDEDRGLMQPALSLDPEHVFLGGDARSVEALLGIPGEEILYVGDHMFSDVKISKSINRWRTALVVRELEPELEALEDFKPKQRALSGMMREKDQLEDEFSQIRLSLQRVEKGYGPQVDFEPSLMRKQMQSLRAELVELDAQIAPLAQEAGAIVNQRWGPLMRAGNDKSHLARQIERYADIYMSRVSNLLRATPFVYLRSPRGSLPHDHGPAGGA